MILSCCTGNGLWSARNIPNISTSHATFCGNLLHLRKEVQLSDEAYNFLKGSKDYLHVIQILRQSGVPQIANHRQKINIVWFKCWERSRFSQVHVNIEPSVLRSRSITKWCFCHPYNQWHDRFCYNGWSSRNSWQWKQELLQSYIEAGYAKDNPKLNFEEAISTAEVSNHITTHFSSKANIDTILYRLENALPAWNIYIWQNNNCTRLSKASHISAQATLWKYFSNLKPRNPTKDASSNLKSWCFLLIMELHVQPLEASYWPELSKRDHHVHYHKQCL